MITFPQSVEKATAGRPAIEYVFSGQQGKRDSVSAEAQESNFRASGGSPSMSGRHAHG